MTAPTPVEAASEGIESAPVGAPVTLPYSQAVALWSALAAVTAERDQAREALATDNKLGAFETGKTIGAAEVRKELDQARQMLADAQRKIASMELDESLREEDERFADPL